MMFIATSLTFMMFAAAMLLFVLISAGHAFAKTFTWTTAAILAVGLVGGAGLLLGVAYWRLPSHAISPLQAIVPSHAMVEVSGPLFPTAALISVPSIVPGEVFAQVPDDAQVSDAADVSEVDAVLPVPPPQWTRRNELVEDGWQFPVVHSGQYADETSALADATMQADGPARLAYRAAFGQHDIWLAPGEAASFVVRQSFIEPIRRSTGTHDFTVYRAHLMLDTRTDALLRLDNLRRSRERDDHLMVTVATTVGLTLLCGLTTLYLRIGSTPGRRAGTLGRAAVATVGVLLLGGGAFAAVRHARHMDAPQFYRPAAPVPDRLHAPYDDEDMPPRSQVTSGVTALGLDLRTASARPMPCPPKPTGCWWHGFARGKKRPGRS